MPWYMNTLFAQAPAQEPGSLWFIHVLTALGVIVVSIVLGNYLGKSFRMPDHSWKISLCLFSLLASAAVLVMGPVLKIGPELKLGVDLRGGVILIYKVDESQQPTGQRLDDDAMKKLIDAVKRRVNPGGQKEVIVRSRGGNQVEVVVPEVTKTEVERIKHIISRSGSLEFRILANRTKNADLMERALANPARDKVVDRSGHVEAWWVPVCAGEEKSISSYPEIAKRPKRDNPKITEVLVVPDSYNVTGGYLPRAEPGIEKGQPCVQFNFNAKGAQLFGELTQDHLPDKVGDFSYKLAIILDGELYSAPAIKSTIWDSGQITGSFTDEQVQDLVNVLNAGSLPAALTKEPISEFRSDPTLGADTVVKGRNAMIISSIAVPVFMLMYYHFCGLVAVIALVLNMLVLFAVMIAFNAAFTLTGFAGLALTVGMAVDNNILVFERLREEIGRGATLRMAIRNAFHRAGTTIIDCNTTHLIAAAVLFYLGSDQLRGFALTLGIGVVTSMFTAVFVSHVIFDVAERRRWTSASMWRWIGHTNIDFMGMAPYCIVASVLITVIAVGVSFVRGKSLFDIDFTGGVSVQVLFDKEHDTGAIREKLGSLPKAERLPDLAINGVQKEDERKGLRFDINTSEMNGKKVAQKLWQVFGSELAHNAVAASDPKVIVAAPPPQKEHKPAAQKPAEQKSIMPKPAEPKPAAPSKTPPPKKAQSLSDLPSDALLALADDKTANGLAPMLLAQAAERPTPPKQSAPSPIANPAPTEGIVKEISHPTAPDPFVGGSQTQWKFQRPQTLADVKRLIEVSLGEMKSSLQAVKLTPETVVFQLSSPEPKYEEDAVKDKEYSTWDLKIMLAPEKVRELSAAMQRYLAATPIFPASTEIGAEVAGNTQMVAVYALVASWAGIILYLWVRFQGVAFGLAAVVALIHDVFVMLGGIAISIYVADYLGFLLVKEFKINLPIVAAFLTIIGYSVNDTIVVFDRIREVRGKDPMLTRNMVNASTNQTLSRTLLTSLTVAIVVFVLYIWGGEALHGFAFALVIGVITGTYSSIYIAAPILLWLVGKHKHAA
jgi:SecD/SecF fusion protein